MKNIELFNLFNKQWANVNDIKKIANCGRDRATIIRNNIEKEIEKNGKKLPISRAKLVPMKYVINYLDIDIDYVCEMAKKEKEIEV